MKLDTRNVPATAPAPAWQIRPLELGAWASGDMAESLHGANERTRGSRSGVDVVLSRGGDHRGPETHGKREVGRESFQRQGRGGDSRIEREGPGLRQQGEKRRPSQWSASMRSSEIDRWRSEEDDEGISHLLLLLSHFIIYLINFIQFFKIKITYSEAFVEFQALCHHEPITSDHAIRHKWAPLSWEW